jgi:hypothetical protein
MKTHHPIEALRLKRLNRLQQTVHIASWWLMGQGLLFCLVGTRSAAWFHLRFAAEMVPYLDLAGAALLSLGLFINRAIREASKQYLAVDTLTLFFTLLAAMLLTHRLKGFSLTWFEWLSLAVNVGLSGSLIAFRTKGTQMDAPGTLVALDVKDAWAQARSLAKGGAANSEAPPSVSAEAPPPSQEEEPLKPISQAMPHLD